MKNYIQEGKILTLTAPYARSSGEGAKVGNIFGVAVADVANGAAGEFLTEGVCELKKVGSQAWSVGDLIYWDDTNKELTKTSTSNLLVGVAVEAVGSGAGETLGKAKLQP